MGRELPKILTKISKELSKDIIDVYLCGVSALDHLLGNSLGSVIDVGIRSSLVETARHLPDIQFTSTEAIDGFFIEDDQLFLLHYLEDSSFSVFSEPVLDFFFQIGSTRFIDPNDTYYHIHKNELCIDFIDGRYVSWESVCDAAVLRARGYSDQKIPYGSLQIDGVQLDSTVYQKAVLTRLLESPKPEEGFKTLSRSGFIEEHWTLLSAMIDTLQDKDYHPEGDVWDHTMQMFSQRKGKDLILGLAILLHDCGKPFAEENKKNRFDRHAQIGSKKAYTFLTGLGFDRQVIDSVCFLVRNHMIPAYAPTLPLYRFEAVISSPLYPLLLELFRCDISSSFRSMDMYYDACDHYKRFQKFSVNPYRDSSGNIVKKRR